MNGSAGPTAASGGEVLDGIAWNAWFASRIADAHSCPVCMRPAVFDGVCRHCGADLRGEAGQRIWTASQAAAEALNRREQLLRTAPFVEAATTAPTGMPAVAPPDAHLGAPAGALAETPLETLTGKAAPAPVASRSNATLQSMFALAGAGLVAVAAIVFTFFNPDFDNRVLRSAIVAGATLVFLVVAWWLAKRENNSSAETMGGLAAVFVGIDIWALAQSASSGSGAWLLAALVTLACAVVALLLSGQIGLRSWSATAMLGFALVPAMFGYAAGGLLPVVLGHLGMVLVIAAQFEWLPRFARVTSEQSSRSSQGVLGRPQAGRAERVLLSALQIVAALSSIPMLGVSLITGAGNDEVLVGLLLLGFFAAAACTAKHVARGFWSLVAGASGAGALPAALFGAYELGSWQLTIITAAATLGAASMVALSPRLRRLSQPQLSYAAVAVPAVFALPTLLSSLAIIASLHSDNFFAEDAALQWSFAVNAMVISAGAAVCARLLWRRAAARASLLPLREFLRVVSVVFAMFAALTVSRMLLGQAGLGGVVLDSLVTSIALLLALAVTLARRTSVLAWRTVLAVAALPFIVGVIAVIEVRGGWTALTTACMFALALTLLMSTRTGIGAFLRSAAAAMLLPSLAVSLVCLGAEALQGSASPVVLPLIAMLLCIALAVSKSLFARVPSHAGPARIAFEASTLLTAAITVLLALTREAAGLGTACVVLLLLGLGGALLARFGERRYGWALAGLSFSGALWCGLGLGGVTVPEAYLLPPSLAAALLATWLCIRGSRQAALYSAGMGAAILTVLAMLVWGGDAGAALRAAGLIAAGWVLAALAGLLLREGHGRQSALHSLRAPTLVAAMAAGLAGPLFAARLGAGGALFVTCLAVSAAGAGAMLFAAHGLRRAVPRLRDAWWPEAPAVVALAAGCWWAIDRNWADIWSMWGLMAAYLVAMVVVVRRQLSSRGPKIPVALLFAIALVTAIVAWSPRDLRVDVFSLPLGLMLTLAGALAMARNRREQTGTNGGSEPRIAGPRGLLAILRWPLGPRGSWPLLGPGIIVTVLASILATFTDPQTWRAILVMVIALIAMLIGARLRLAAPFLLGLIVLPVENVFVFAVQIGRGIDSMPWWITLATIGAVLLSIAVVSEQRSGSRQGSANQGSANQGSANQGSANQGSARQGSARQGFANQGFANQGLMARMRDLD